MFDRHLKDIDKFGTDTFKEDVLIGIVLGVVGILVYYFIYRPFFG